MLTGARYLKRGYPLRDPEDTRMTARLGAAAHVLEASGVKMTVIHNGNAHDDTGVCDYRCTTAWPQWITDEVFEHAFALVDTIIGQRGKFNRAEAAKLKSNST